MESTVKTFKISKRLEAIKNMVPEGAVPVDIGTDHGYVPITLVQEGVVEKAVAADILEGPLAAATEHIQSAGLSDKISVVLSDGFANLSEGCADTAIICGMGGMTILKILEGRHTVGAGLIRLVLSPQSDAEKVRAYLRDEGFVIDAEDMVFEDGKFYPVIRSVDRGTDTLSAPLAVADSVSVPLSTPLSASLSAQQCAEDMFGPKLIEEKNEVLVQYLNRRKQVIDKVKADLSRSENAERTQAKLAELDAELKLIETAEQMMR